MGQRLFTTFVFLVLLILGVAAGGQAGTFPAQAAGGTVISPDYVLELLGKIITPALLLGGIARGIFLTINAKVVDGSIKSGDWLGLLRLPEFWAAIISFAVGVIQIFTKTVILDEASQAVLVSSIMGVVTLLLNSFGARPNKAQEPTELKMATKAQSARVPTEGRRT